MKNYLLTGGTGAIGSALVPILLEQPDTMINLLIRARDESDLTARLDRLFEFWGAGIANEKYRFRIRAVRGDTTEPRFGLHQTDFDRLCPTITHIVHAAGLVRMNLPIEDARKSAVGSARNVLSLGECCPHLEKIEFVSTVGVGGRWPGTVPERRLIETRKFHNTYEQAKAEAEDVVHGAIASGLPVTIHRPSMVVGDSQTGKIIHFQVFYHLCEFLSGRRTLGLSPDLGEAQLDIIPTDFVGRAIAWSSCQHATIGHTLHLCSGPENAPTLRDVRFLVRKLFSQSGLWVPPAIELPPSIFRSILTGLSWLAPPATRRAIRTLPVFLDYLSSNQKFGNTSTLGLLKEKSLNLPLADQYLTVVINNYLQNKHAH